MNAQTSKTQNESVTPEATEEKNSSPELTVRDLLVLRSIIDTASERGAFKPSEMSAVGYTYEKLDRFLKAVDESQKTEKTEVKT